LLTCHDEYLLASMVQGIDGALLGFASLVPGLIHELLTDVALVTPPIVMFIERLFHWGQQMPLTIKSAA
jgi:4-hydroxy-tetrahydrodipicolinate synthase